MSHVCPSAPLPTLSINRLPSYSICYVVSIDNVIVIALAVDQQSNKAKDYAVEHHPISLSPVPTGRNSLAHFLADFRANHHHHEP